MAEERWYDLGALDELRQHPLRQLTLGRTKLALSYKDGEFGAISGLCNHVGGPLGGGHLDGDYVVCPWHHWKFHCRTGEGEAGFEADRVPRYELREENGHLFVNLEPASRRGKLPHEPHPLARRTERAPGPPRVLGIATSAMDRAFPRYSTSEALLESALDSARDLGAEARLIRLNDLSFRACEGYYSKSAQACTWPCSITQMDPADELTDVYEGIVHWGDVILVSTPIRWGAASSLYYKMVERMNCIQNQITLSNRVLLQNKVAAFIILGGQDNVQAVAGQMLGFFGELGCVFPQFPFIAHTRGWDAEDMEKNVELVMKSRNLHDGARELAARSIELARILLAAAGSCSHGRVERAGRKAGMAGDMTPEGTDRRPGETGEPGSA
jgi:nitrite reductase/ring-hydroxylating ferredoxin subunit/multimeric flavodoxin WrbA